MKNNSIFSALAASLILSGCAATAQPPSTPVDTNATEKVVKHEYVYETDKKIKEAIVILIRKMEALESSGAPVAKSADFAAMKSELERIKTGSNTKELEKRIKALEEKLASVQKKGGSGTCTKTFLYTVHKSAPYMAKQNVNVRPCPSYESMPSGLIKKGEVVYFEGCNEYGWCKIKGGKGYVAGHFFKKISSASSSSAQSGSRKGTHDAYDKAIMQYLKE